MVAEDTFRGFFYLLQEEYTSDNNKRITYKPIDNKIICRALLLVMAMISWDLHFYGTVLPLLKLIVVSWGRRALAGGANGH